jgi:hypothetical protein
MVYGDRQIRKPRPLLEARVVGVDARARHAVGEKPTGDDRIAAPVRTGHLGARDR